MSLENHRTSQVMKQLDKLGWVKCFSPAIKGQYYFSPRGTRVFNLMANFLKNWVQKELNSLEIRTPMLYDWFDPSIQAESSAFYERVFQSVIESKTGVWRPGGDYGVMSLLANRMLSEKHLPVSLFELATSFRKAQSRELSGLLKARAFTLLDHHTFSTHSDKAWENYTSIIFSQMKLANFFELSWTLHLQVEKTFLVENTSLIQGLEKKLNTEIHLIELEQRTNYWTLQHHFMDTKDNIGFSDGQYDEVNAKNYGIQYVSSDGKSKHFPIICHGSFDSVERWIFKLVNRAIVSQGKNFPCWLSPVHARLIPSNEPTLAIAEEIKHKGTQYGIMIEIDYRKKSVFSRIEQALHEWVPFIVTFQASGKLDLMVLTLDENQALYSMDSLFDVILKQLKPLNFLTTSLDEVIGKPCLQ